jgi:hypothetical protein
LLILDTESEGSKSKTNIESPLSTGKKDGQQSQKHHQIRQYPDLFLLSDTLMDLACTKLFTSTNINATNTTITNTSTEESEQDAVRHVVDEKDYYYQRYVHLLPETEVAQILRYLAIRQKKKISPTWTTLHSSQISQNKL